MILPHGGKLINMVAGAQIKETILKKNYPVIRVTKGTFDTVENIASGLYSPLKGFLGKEDFLSVLKKGRLSNGTPWTLPVVFDVKKGELERGQKVFLRHRKALALFSVKEVYPYSKKDYARRVFQTEDENHPGVQRLNERNELLAEGPVILLEPSQEWQKSNILKPVQARELFRQKGWNTVAAFQTRNVPHIGHESLQKAALNICSGILINPVMGKKKPGDFKDSLIKRTYQVLISHYFPKENVLLGAINYEMQYAGPREAVHHAIMRKNLGCTHFIIGRDHAGVGDYYHPFAAQEIFKDYPDLGITPLFLSSFSYCRKCRGVVSENSCPHTGQRIEFKGTKLREALLKGKNPSKNLMRPEVAEIIKKHKNPFV